MLLYTKLIIVIVLIQVVTLTTVFLFSYFSRVPHFVNLAKHLHIGGSFLAVIGVFITILVFRSEYDKQVMELTLAATHDNLLDIHDIFVQNYDDCPEYINSLRFDFEKDKNEPRNFRSSNDNNDKSEIAKRMISVKILQSVENYFLTSPLTATSDSKVMFTFLGYLTSLEFQHKYYPTLKGNVGIQARNYIEKLIEINNKNKFKSADEVIEYTNKFVLSGQLSHYLDKTDPTNLTQK